jgi:hypothetical protein
MKRIISFSTLGAALVFCAGIFGGCQASEEHARSVLKAGEVHEGWYFAAGQTVLIEGTVNGDVYVAGGEVEIAGRVNGDVLVAGGSVEVSGIVSQDVRAGGGTVRVSGTVDGNCTLAGGNVVLASDAVVKQNVLALAGSVRISGRVAKELKVAGGELNVSGDVGEDLTFYGDKVQIMDGARVGGKATFTVEDSNNVSVAQGTVPAGVEIKTRALEAKAPAFEDKGAGYLFGALYTVSLILMALLVAYVFPRKMREAKVLVKGGFGMTFLWGFLGVLGLPVVVVILLVVVVGIPLGLFVLVLYLWFLYLSQLSLPLLASAWIVKDEAPPGWKLFWPVALSVIVLQLLMLIPYVGFLLWLVGAILGMGVFLRLTGEAIAKARDAS